MQDNTKDQDTKSRRTNPIRIVDSPRMGAPHADALREVHSSLVRAGQNLYNLVQTNQAPNGAASPTGGLGYPQSQASGIAAPSFATPGFAPGLSQSPYAGFAPAYAAGFPGATANGIGAFGAAATATPWGMTPTATGASWKTLAADIAAALGVLQHAAAILPSAFAPATPGIGAPASQAPACDIIDEGKQFVCLVDLPGLKASQIELFVAEQVLAIGAYREADGDAAGLVQSERGLAAVQRTIALPAEVLPAGVKATLSNGVLSVLLPKAYPTEGPRRVKIQG